MTNPAAGSGARTKVARTIRAPRAAVWRAFTEPDLLARWMPPQGMRGRIHAFEPRAGGAFHMSLTYEPPDAAHRGKATDDTDIVRSRFVEIVPQEKVVWATTFESEDPRFAGVMTIIVRFRDAPQGTEVDFICEDIPAGINPVDNEEGCRSSLENLARLLV